MKGMRFLRDEMKTLFIILTSALMMFGCTSLLPSTRQTIHSPWNSFEEARAAYEKISPMTTTHEEIHELGFDPFTTPNIRILTYLDIMNRFLPNPSIRLEDLDKGIVACIEAKASCKGYEINPQFLKSERYGNVLVDLLNFRRKTKDSGWRFEALIVLVNGTVVYKLWGGTPVIDQTRDEKRPLGPLQSADDIVGGAIRTVF
jgi:hypothetical protein